MEKQKTKFYTEKLVSLILIFIITFSGVFIVEASNTSLKTYIDSLQSNDGALPSVSNQKGIVGTILSTLFDSTGKIKSEFIDGSLVGVFSKNGNKAYYNDGNVGIGTNSPNAKLKIQSTGLPDSKWTWNDIKNNLALELGSNGNGDIGSIKMNSYDSNHFVLQRPSNGNYHIDSTTGQYYFNWDESVRGSSNGAIHMANQAGSHTVELNTAGNSWLTGGNLGIGTSSPNSRFKMDVNGAVKVKGGIRAYTDSSFDCTFGGEFPDNNTSFKFNLGNGVYKCLYMFYVGNAWASEQNHVYKCSSHGFKDASGLKIPLYWRKDSTEWQNMWNKARNTRSYGRFLFFGNAGDYNAHYYMGINFIYHYSYPYKVYKEHGRYNYANWQSPLYGNSQRSNYAGGSFVLCEL